MFRHRGGGRFASALITQNTAAIHWRQPSHNFRNGSQLCFVIMVFWSCQWQEMSKLIHQNTLAWVIGGIWRYFPKGLDMPKKNMIPSYLCNRSNKTINTEYGFTKRARSKRSGWNIKNLFFWFWVYWVTWHQHPWICKICKALKDHGPLLPSTYKCRVKPITPTNNCQCWIWLQ